MAQNVWTLSVDLQTRTATFQSGMADAAKAARGSFGEIKDGAREMGAATGGSMTEARHGVMLLGEEFGVHLPRALTSFIASIGPVGAAMQGAFPFLAIIVGATLLIEHLGKVKEAGERLTENQEKFSTAVANAFNSVDQKILEAEIRADELNNNHYAALQNRLQLIDMQTMSNLSAEFDKLAAKADTVFAGLTTHFFQLRSGSDGAKHALEEFKNKYDLLLAQGNGKEASDLLGGTLKSAREVLELQKQAAAYEASKTTPSDEETTRYQAALATLREKQVGVGLTHDEIASQQQLVDILQVQVALQGRMSTLKKDLKSNATQTTDKQTDADNEKFLHEQWQAAKRAADEENKIWDEHYRDELADIEENERLKIEATESGSAARLAAIDAAIKEEQDQDLEETGFYRSLLTSRVQTVRQMANEEAKLKADAGKEAAEHTSKMGELQLAADKEAAQLRMSIHRVNAQEQLAEHIKEANAEYKVKMDGLDGEIAALNKHAQDYENKLKALQDKERELTKQHENQVQQIKDKSLEDQTTKLNSAMARMETGLSQSLLGMLTGHRSFASEMRGITEQLASNILSAAIAEKNGLGSTKLDEAKAAARKMYLAGTHFPWPTNIVMAPTLAAVGFAAMMAFEGGGIVPGVAHGDVVPAMLTPGETVIPKDMTERLNRATDSGGGQTRGETHFHYHATHHIHAIDGASVEKMLDKHGDKFERHFFDRVRNMNR
jgi:hypothetical protein